MSKIKIKKNKPLVLIVTYNTGLFGKESTREAIYIYTSKSAVKKNINYFKKIPAVKEYKIFVLTEISKAL